MKCYLSVCLPLCLSVRLSVYLNTIFDRIGSLVFLIFYMLLGSCKYERLIKSGFFRKFWFTKVSEKITIFFVYLKKKSYGNLTCCSYGIHLCKPCIWQSFYNQVMTQNCESQSNSNIQERNMRILS